jgi:hypothetical protein
MLDSGSFITDGGLETTLIFHDGFELPDFAAFILLDSEEGRAALRAHDCAESPGALMGLTPLAELTKSLG